MIALVSVLWSLACSTPSVVCLPLEEGVPEPQAVCVEKIPNRYVAVAIDSLWRRTFGDGKLLSVRGVLPPDLTNGTVVPGSSRAVLLLYRGTTSPSLNHTLCFLCQSNNLLSVCRNVVVSLVPSPLLQGISGCRLVVIGPKTRHLLFDWPRT